MHPSKRKVLTPVQPSSKSPRTAEYKAIITEECLYESIFKVTPTACLFTIVPEPEVASTIMTPPLSIMDRQTSSQQDDSSLQVTDNTVTNVNAAQISVETARELSRVRIHVERAIGRLKNYNLLKATLPISLIKNPQDQGHCMIDKILFVCCALCNLQPPLIS